MHHATKLWFWQFIQFIFRYLPQMIYLFKAYDTHCDDDGCKFLLFTGILTISTHRDDIFKALRPIEKKRQWWWGRCKFLLFTGISTFGRAPRVSGACSIWLHLSFVHLLWNVIKFCVIIMWSSWSNICTSKRERKHISVGAHSCNCFYLFNDSWRVSFCPSFLIITSFKIFSSSYEQPLTTHT